MTRSLDQISTTFIFNPTSCTGNQERRIHNRSRFMVNSIRWRRLLRLTGHFKTHHQSLGVTFRGLLLPWCLPLTVWSSLHSVMLSCGLFTLGWATIQNTEDLSLLVMHLSMSLTLKRLVYVICHFKIWLTLLSSAAKFVQVFCGRLQRRQRAKRSLYDSLSSWDLWCAVGYYPWQWIFSSLRSWHCSAMLWRSLAPFLPPDIHLFCWLSGEVSVCSLSAWLMH